MFVKVISVLPEAVSSTSKVISPISKLVLVGAPIYMIDQTKSPFPSSITFSLGLGFFAVGL